MVIRANFAAASATLALICLAVVGFAFLCPTDNLFGPLARMLDAYVPWFIGAGLACAVVSLVLGLRRFGAVLAIISVTGAALLYGNYRHLTLPLVPNEHPALRVLFFNALAENTDASDAILAAALKAAPDIMVFSEAKALGPSLADIRAQFDFVSPCSPDQCELLVATNLPVTRFWQLQLNQAFPERYAVLEFTHSNGEQVYLIANHLGKPWLSGFASSEINRLKAQYNWLEAPAIIVGDFNMPPWSLPMRDLLAGTGARSLRGQHATWPADAGLLGLPIDQVLVRDGPRVVAIEPFGAGLGSNHLGFVADIWLPGE